MEILQKLLPSMEFLAKLRLPYVSSVIGFVLLIVYLLGIVGVPVEEAMSIAPANSFQLWRLWTYCLLSSSFVNWIIFVGLLCYVEVKLLDATDKRKYAMTLLFIPLPIGILYLLLSLCLRDISHFSELARTAAPGGSKILWALVIYIWCGGVHSPLAKSYEKLSKNEGDFKVQTDAQPFLPLLVLFLYFMYEVVFWPSNMSSTILVFCSVIVGTLISTPCFYNHVIDKVERRIGECRTCASFTSWGEKTEAVPESGPSPDPDGISFGRTKTTV